MPLSRPTEEAKSTTHAPIVILIVLCAFALAGLAVWAWSSGWVSVADHIRGGRVGRSELGNPTIRHQGALEFDRMKSGMTLESRS